MSLLVRLVVEGFIAVSLFKLEVGTILVGSNLGEKHSFLQVKL